MRGYVTETLSVRYGSRAALAEVDVAVEPGKVVVVAGPNGAGKSTLLKTLAGEITPSSGRVLLDGEDIASLPRALVAARRGVLPQSSNLSFPFTVHEVVRVGLSGVSRAHRRRTTIADALDRVDLGAFAGRPYHELSGGERQRVHLARVLCQVPEPLPGEAPRYLFLDEPTSGLDLRHQTLILRIAREFAAAGGGVLAVLHDLNLAATYADEILVVAAGRIAARGAPAEVITDGLLRTIFGVEIAVSTAPAPGTPYILPQAMGRRTAGRDQG
ncbi:MAG: heme ABC transporter ATP-binding protein [Bauldia sp.]